MNTLFISIAGFSIKISFKKKIHSYLRKGIANFLKSFIVSKQPEKIDFHIEFVEKLQYVFIKRKHESFTAIPLYEEVNDRKIITYNYICSAQFMIILRRIVEKLINSSGFFLHASACLINNKAFLFLGKSGAGKSTVTQLLSKKYPILADDVTIMKKEDNGFFLYQTPFVDKRPFFKSPRKYPLDKILFLHKSKKYTMVKIKQKNQVLKRIMSQIWTETERYKQEKIKFVLKFLSTFENYYVLYFGKNQKKLKELFD